MSDLAAKMTRRTRTAPPIAESAAKAEEAEELERLSIDVPKDLKKRLKMRAAEDETTIRTLVIDALEDVLR